MAWIWGTGALPRTGKFFRLIAALEAIQVRIACDDATIPDVIPGRKYVEIHIQTRIKQAS
jgi:hypothetical protein